MDLVIRFDLNPQRWEESGGQQYGRGVVGAQRRNWGTFS
ncbi:hypothetical protein EBBID32_36140 [Sphingobium indicum BiD32]|uniref:Uncharacterized protein n=1 Tax=Sphingobium indicum BiD32 TaxID=1301087 RepID=N1MVB1_9SPHN|nr:hypothetical protein EBBID32_36140 [Sphingobium indicum BiD32]